MAWLGAAAIGATTALVSTPQTAQAVQLQFGGIVYEIDVIRGSYNGNTTKIQATQWWNQPDLAFNLALKYSETSPTTGADFAFSDVNSEDPQHPVMGVYSQKGFVVDATNSINFVDYYAVQASPTAVPYKFNSTTGLALGVPLFVGLRMLKTKRRK